MSAIIKIMRAGPLTSIQDAGRHGMLRHGVSASGPMDRGAFEAAGRQAGAGSGGLEFTMAGLEINVASGMCQVGFAGGDFVLRHNGSVVPWTGTIGLEPGDTLAITPGSRGNYGYLRFGGDLLAAPMMGSLATNSRAGLGGYEGRSLRAGDVLEIGGMGADPQPAIASLAADGPFRVLWGLHADLFLPEVRRRFIDTPFQLSGRMDRMGVRLDDNEGVFGKASALSLVSDAIVPGDIQILGDGTPIVLMRDHQPTGGYPRIATMITTDLDRFAQMRPGSTVSFTPITLDHAQALLRSARP